MSTIANAYNDRQRDLDKVNARTPAAERDRARERIAQADLNAEFEEALGEEYASHLNDKQKELIFDKAWSDGHSSGYSEVEVHYEELVTFVDKIRAN